MTPRTVKTRLYLAPLILSTLSLNPFPATVSNFSSNDCCRPLEAGASDCPSTSLDYRVWRTVRSEDDDGEIYLSFVSVKKDLFNRECMSELSERLKQRFRRKSRIKAFLFDNDKVAEGYAKGKYEGRDLHLLMRGMFYYDISKRQGYIKFSSAEGKPWDEVTVKLSR